MRKHYLDNIRWITVVLVVFYHIIYIFNGICKEGVAGPFSDFQIQDAVQYILYPWFMVILFIVSGITSRLLLEKQTTKEFIKSRTQKFLVPSTIGLFVFQWIQGFFNMQFSHAFENFSPEMPKTVIYIIMAISGTGVLWFIQMLWIFSMILVLVKKIDKNDNFYNLCEKTNVLIVVLMGFLSFGFSKILNTPVILVYRFGIYGFAFFSGYFVFSHENVIQKISRFFIPFSVIAVVSAVFYVKLYFGQSYVVPPVVNCPLASVYLWFACLSILGGSYRFLNKTNAFFTFMRQNNFGLYVFHYLPLSMAAYFLSFSNIPPFLQYIITGFSAFIGAILLNAAISRIPFLRWCVLGIKKEKTKEIQTEQNV